MLISAIDLRQAWYDAVVEAFNLSPLTFLMAGLLIPLGSTSRDLWDYFDSVPLAGNDHYYEPQDLNRFSEGYGAVVNLIIPQAGTSVVSVAQERFLGAAGVYAFSRSMDEALDLVSRGPQCQFSFASSPSTAAARPQNAAGGPKLTAAKLGGETLGFVESVLDKVAASHVVGNVLFNHQAPVSAAPLATQEIVGDKEYPPWFSAAALRYAYETRDATVWPAGMKPTWDQTFGPSGNLNRVTTQVVLVDGVNVELTSDADLIAGELTALQQAASAGITPLFSFADPAELQGAGFRAAAAPPLLVSIAPEGSALKIHIESPLGNVMLFGVIASPPIDTAG
jgi:hypothetical protein